MAFALAHFFVHLFLYKKSSAIFDVKSTFQSPTPCLIEFTYNFSQQQTPESYDITIHGLTRKDAALFAKGESVSIWAGWRSDKGTSNNIKHIFTSHISNIQPLTNDSGDWVLQITCTDGLTIPNNTASQKAKSESKRNGASGENSRSGIAAARKAADQLLTRWGKGKSSMLQKASRQLTKALKGKRLNLTKTRKAVMDKLRKMEKANSDAFHRGHHNLAKGKGEKAANAKIRAMNKQNSAKFHAGIKRIMSLRKSAEKRFKDASARLRKSGTSKRSEIKKHRQRISKAKKSKRNHIRTKFAGKEERSKRAKSKKKSKSKKTKQTGLHFKKNTKASKIIKVLAKKDKIHISKMKLVKDKKYTNGYTADKNLRQAIHDVAADCNSEIWFPNGKLVIGDFSKGYPTGLTLTPETGLLQTPQEQTDDDDDDSSKTVATYNIVATFLPGVTAGSLIKIIDPAESVTQLEENVSNHTATEGSNDQINRGGLFNDKVIVLSGSSEESSGQVETELTVERQSDVKKGKIANLKKKAKKAKAVKAKKKAKAKAHKDKVRRSKVKKARKARQAKRAKHTKSSRRARKSSKHSSGHKHSSSRKRKGVNIGKAVKKYKKFIPKGIKKSIGKMI